MSNKYLSMEAEISECGKYRYSLTRVWDESLPTCCFIGLNPSTADANEDDPTIRRCVGFAKSFGCGKLIMVNLWAYRATDPDDLIFAILSNIISEEESSKNNKVLISSALDSKYGIAAWGNDGEVHGFGKIVLNGIGSKLHYLKLNNTGQPAHPLYLPKRLKPIPFPPGYVPGKAVESKNA